VVEVLVDLYEHEAPSTIERTIRMSRTGVRSTKGSKNATKPSTMKWYGYILSAFSNKFPTYAATPVNKITTAHIDAILRKLRDENKTASTIRGYHKTLSRILGYARKSLKLITENPCDDATRPKATTEPREVEWCTEEEL
jgi:site-specific recombinase XerD